MKRKRKKVLESIHTASGGYTKSQSKVVHETWSLNDQYFFFQVINLIKSTFVLFDESSEKAVARGKYDNKQILESKSLLRLLSCLHVRDCDQISLTTTLRQSCSLLARSLSTIKYKRHSIHVRLSHTFAWDDCGTKGVKCQLIWRCWKPNSKLVSVLIFVHFILLYLWWIKFRATRIILPFFSLRINITLLYFTHLISRIVWFDIWVFFWGIFFLSVE